MEELELIIKLRGESQTMTTLINSFDILLRVNPSSFSYDHN